MKHTFQIGRISGGSTNIITHTIFLDLWINVQECSKWNSTRKDKCLVCICSDLFLNLAEDFMKDMWKEGFFHPAFPVHNDSPWSCVNGTTTQLSELKYWHFKGWWLIYRMGYGKLKFESLGVRPNWSHHTLELTVVQSDEKYSLNHVIDVKLFTKLLSGAEGATDFCHRVVIVVNTVWDRVFWLWLAISRVLHCNTRYTVIKTYKYKTLFLNLHTESSYTQTIHVVKRLQQPILTVRTWFSRRLLRFLSWCKLLGISHGAEKGSEWVAGDVLVVVALVSHFTGAQLIPLNIPAFRSNTSKVTYGITITVISMKTRLCQKGSCSLTTRENTYRKQYGLDGLLTLQLSFLIYF